MRCFIGVDIPEGLKPGIIELQKHLSGYDVKLVEPQNLHFTLKFLGDIPEPEKISSRIRSVKMPSFEMELAGAGCFPSEKFIRVVWIGAYSKDIINLQKTVEDALYPEFPREKFAPHLTIARARSQKFRDEISELIKKNGETFIGKMKVEGFSLKKSVLAPEGPVYTDIEKFRLS